MVLFPADGDAKNASLVSRINFDSIKTDAKPQKSNVPSKFKNTTNVRMEDSTAAVF